MRIIWEKIRRFLFFLLTLGIILVVLSVVVHRNIIISAIGESIQGVISSIVSVVIVIFVILFLFRLLL